MNDIEDATRQAKNWLKVKNVCPGFLGLSTYSDFILAFPQNQFVLSDSSQNPRTSVPEPTLSSALPLICPILSSPRVRSVWTTY